jgi:galactokinase
VEENQRVLAIADALAAGNPLQAGHLMNESFIGARDLYEIVSEEMIAMQESIMSADGALGVRGAGAGFGGCMVALVKSGKTEPFASHVAQNYKARTGIEPHIYPGIAADGAGVLDF